MVPDERSKFSAPAVSAKDFVDSIDGQDPLARFLKNILQLNWLKFYFLALLIYGPIEKLIIPAMGGYLDLDGGILEWTPHIEALLTGFVEFPFFLAFYLWTGEGIAKIFSSLIDHNSFTDLNRYEHFLQKLQKDFNRWYWTVISAVMAVLGMLLMHMVVWSPDSAVPPWFGDRLYARLLGLVLIGLVVYAITQVVIRGVLTGQWLQRLWAELGDDLVLHPYHPDSAGGLGAIGQYIAFFFYFVVFIMLFIIMGTFLPAILQAATVMESGELHLSIRFWSPLIILIWVLYLLIVPSLFFLLTWPTHQAMIKIRDEHLNRLSLQLDQQLDVTKTNIAEDQSALSDTLGKIKSLKTARDIYLEDFPTWPINRETRRLFSLTAVLPTAYSLLTVVVDLLL